MGLSTKNQVAYVEPVNSYVDLIPAPGAGQRIRLKKFHATGSPRTASNQNVSLRWEDGSKFAGGAISGVGGWDNCDIDFGEDGIEGPVNKALQVISTSSVAGVTQATAVYDIL
jgi:hypothetical protein